MKDERGQILPLLGAAMIMALVVGFLLFQVGAAARLSTDGQTAGDAAALAAAQDVERQLQENLLRSGGGMTAQLVDWNRVELAAADYARRNGAEVVGFTHADFDVLVTVRTLKTLEAPTVDRATAKATQRARARVDATYSLGLPAFGAGAAGGGGAGGGSHFQSDAQLRALSDRAGVPVRADSALRRYGGTGNGVGVDVADLQEPMQIAILKAEGLLGGPILINSGYRTAAYQAYLCATQGGMGGRCAPPGQSLHNHGLAIDVANYRALAGVALEAGMCQPFPLPGDDNVHFSIIDGPECGGRGGALAAGQAYGGNLASFAQFKVRLVPWDGAGA